MLCCFDLCTCAGTPLQNNLHELWALLNFLMPEVFCSADSFDTWFNIVDKQATENVIKKLHTVLKPFMLRRVRHCSAGM